MCISSIHLPSTWRIAPEVGYIFRNDGKSGFAASVDTHFLSGWRGASSCILSRASRSTTGATGTMTPRAAEAWMSVLTFDVYFTSQLKMTVQAKYSFMNDTGGAFV